jgi:hypothetical protein
MNRISIQISTGKVIEMQTGGDTDNQELANTRLNTLKQNAINGGIAESDIEVKWVTEDEWNTIKNSDAVFKSYQEKRSAEYPNFKDYLDGVVKNDQAQIQAYIDACMAVKQKYPKE